MLNPIVKKFQPPTGEYVWRIHVQSPTGRQYRLYLYPEKTILSVCTAKYKRVKVYSGEPIDTKTIIQTVRMNKEIRKFFLDILSKPVSYLEGLCHD